MKHYHSFSYFYTTFMHSLFSAVKKASHFIIGFLLLLSFGISGLLYVLYDVAQYIDKREAQEHITAREHLQVIKLSLRDFRASADTREIRVGGRLYDISSYIIGNDSVTMLVFS